MMEEYFEVYENGTKRIASGFQFITDAHVWMQMYRNKNPECGPLTIVQVKNGEKNDIYTK